MSTDRFDRKHELKMIEIENAHENGEHDEEMNNDCSACDERAYLDPMASLEHLRWARWMAYLFSKCTLNADGSATISKDDVLRWGRQIKLHYDELSEKEKQSDRREVREQLQRIEDAKNGKDWRLEDRFQTIKPYRQYIDWICGDRKEPRP